MNRTTRSYPGRRPISGRSRISFVAPLLVLAGTLAIASCSTSFKEDDVRENQTILIRRGASKPEDVRSFSPNPVTILVKTEVLWANEDTLSHQIASVGDLFRAEEPILPGGEYRYLFNKPGNYRYYCLVSGHREQGVINVLP